MKVVQYYIVARTDFTSLSDAVDKFMREGWEPQGGIVSTLHGYYLQAIVKRGEG